VILRLFLISLIFLAAGRLCAQKDSARPVIDSVRHDTMMYGPPYQFTGAEDSLLLARVFEQTYKLGLGDAGGHIPDIVCLAVGRLHPADAPASVLRLLAHDHPAVRPASKCSTRAFHQLPGVVESATGKTAWIVTISSLSPASGNRLTVHSSDYVASLWATGWVCQAERRANDWLVLDCTSAWIS